MRSTTAKADRASRRSWLSRLLPAVALVAIGIAHSPAFAVDLSQYRLVWRDEFNGAAGAKPAPHWFFFDGWGSTKWRDAYYTNQDAYMDGSGHLLLRSRLVNGRFTTSYLQTYNWAVPKSQWKTFGPGKGKYIEARVSVQDMQAKGPWAGFWLFDPSDTYDGNTANGTEIDIFEYVMGGNWFLNRYNAANHWGPLGAGWGHDSRYIDTGAMGINLRSGYHTVGVEWTPTKLVYHVDGRPVWTTTKGVSTSNEQAIILSIEYDQGPGDAWGINQNVLNEAGKLPDYFKVDYVRVYERK